MVVDHGGARGEFRKSRHWRFPYSAQMRLLLRRHECKSAQELSSLQQVVLNWQTMRRLPLKRDRAWVGESRLGLPGPVNCGKGSATALERMKHSGRRSQETGANAMWGGRFSPRPAPSWKRSTPRSASTSAWPPRTSRARSPTAPCWPSRGSSRRSDRDAIHRGLQQVLGEIEAGTFTFSTALEDIHMNVESRLKEIVGDPAGAPPHRAQPQRPGRRSTSASGCATPMTGPTRSSPSLMQGAARTRRSAHAGTVMPGLHASPERPARDLRPPPAWPMWRCSAATAAASAIPASA